MCSCISLGLRCFTLELLFPVLTKRQGDVLVSTEEPIGLICHQDREWRVFKNPKDAHTLWILKRLLGHAADGLELFCSLFLSASLPLSSSSFLQSCPHELPLQLTPTCTQTCLNYHHRVVFCLLFYQLLNRALSTLNTRKRRPSSVHGGGF